jgi:P27 family predicted phage terminase small subunit
VRANRPNQKQTALDRQLGKPTPPVFLIPEALAEWDAQCETLHRLGMVTALDNAVFGAYAQSYGRWQRAEKMLAEITLDGTDEKTDGFLIQAGNGKLIPHPLADIARTAMADAVKYASEIGLTPSSRSRVHHAEPPNDPNDPTMKYLT